MHDRQTFFPTKQKLTVNFEGFFCHFQMFDDVIYVVFLAKNYKCPIKKTAHREKQQKNIPKPQNDEDFFIENIDEQNTLNSVILKISHDSNLEITISYTWKKTRLFPCFSSQQIGYCTNSEKFIF